MLTSPLKWHGGKGGYHGKLAQWIVSLMPKHLHYVEPFAGGLSVLLAKDPNGISEVVNDTNGDLTNFWRVLANPIDFKDFVRHVQACPFSESLWQTAHEVLEQDRKLTNLNDRAVAFFIVVRQSLAGRLDTFAPVSRNRIRRGMNEQVSAWLSAVDGLSTVHERLKRVLILNRPAIEVIRQHDGPQTLFYLDPPYLHSTRATTGEYGEHEMSRDDHIALQKLLATIKGKFLLSGYRSDLYDIAALECGWDCHEFKIPNCAAGGDKKRTMTECVWTNF